jgi:hypothetical protein
VDRLYLSSQWHVAAAFEKNEDVGPTPAEDKRYPGENEARRNAARNIEIVVLVMLGRFDFCLKSRDCAK